eukprot:CAMPEP_0173396978 /NCGR_PEP_ID=MMETSP1356-20130122/37086_1 /TAXON_ID=77927 ORGANISM="Hemiselmis virescens, Strain PCC157" /NCGR_SAMPLE_ID=MMETSP1356 /ASSEMBLY_ACC=CAM_ASM_000847 /LENGTH=60 /DNA_ID=CAMNT_0014356131 /DNA_START=26 /DNA_END=204 /DNA_ORIENTATION=-
MADTECTDDGSPLAKIVNKRLRLVRKKMQKIELLESKSAEELNPEQAALLASKPIQKTLL